MPPKKIRANLFVHGGEVERISLCGVELAGSIKVAHKVGEFMEVAIEHFNHADEFDLDAQVL